jgi:hypothetical protein
MSDETYNGWTNRETWATALHIDNEQRLQAKVLELAKENQTQRELADAIESWIDDYFDENWVQARTMREDIGSLYRVNWWEIAEGYLIKTSEGVNA